VVLADLEHHGLDVVALQDVLRGAHVLIDDPSLYQRWQFGVQPSAHLQPPPRHRQAHVLQQRPPGLRSTSAVVKYGSPRAVRRERSEFNTTEA
jgi:hypothetical protein